MTSSQPARPSAQSRTQPPPQLPTPGAAQLDLVRDLGDFVAAAPSSYHAVAEVARRLREAGFSELAEEERWPGVRGEYYVVRDGAIIAWRAPSSAAPSSSNSCATPMALRIFGAHTDSPGLKLKPQPSTSAHGWLQAGVEIYGGGLLNSYLDRELELAGRICDARGAVRLVRSGPLLRIAQLAPHLDRSVNESLHLDRQRHLNPLWGLEGTGDGDLLGLLARAAGMDKDQIAGYDIVTVDSQPSRTFGLDEQLFASARLDNLLSVHAGLTALLAAEPAGDAIQMLAAFDHEEIGSQTRSGADGSFLHDTLTRIAAVLGGGEEERLRGWAASSFVSCDVGHSINPNYPEKHDPVVRPVAGGGPMLKINANQRYVTDAVGEALWRLACARAGVPCQEFVSNNSSPCGSTIGPMTAARLGIRTVDVGVPILAMHSARETCASVDPWLLARATEAYFAG